MGKFKGNTCVRIRYLLIKWREPIFKKQKVEREKKSNSIRWYKSYRRIMNKAR